MKKRICSKCRLLESPDQPWSGDLCLCITCSKLAQEPEPSKLAPQSYGPTDRGKTVSPEKWADILARREKIPQMFVDGMQTGEIARAFGVSHNVIGRDLNVPDVQARIAELGGGPPRDKFRRVISRAAELYAPSIAARRTKAITKFREGFCMRCKVQKTKEDFSPPTPHDPDFRTHQRYCKACMNELAKKRNRPSNFQRFVDDLPHRTTAELQTQLGLLLPRVKALREELERRGASSSDPGIVGKRAEVRKLVIREGANQD